MLSRIGRSIVFALGFCAASCGGDSPTSFSDLFEMTVEVRGISGGTKIEPVTPIYKLDDRARVVYRFKSGTVVTVTALPDAGRSTFTAWSGACSGSGACVITMDSNKELIATFAAIAGLQEGSPAR